MGGLWRRMPVTTLTFLIGLLALCGVYGLSGFHSKDAILVAGSLGHTPIYGLLTLGALLTAGYMGRLFWVAFLGSPKTEAASHAKENGWSMLVPLVVLAVLSVAGGWIDLWPEQLGVSIRSQFDLLHHTEGYKEAHKNVLMLGSGAWVLGLAAAFLLYGAGASEDRLARKAPPVYELLRSRLWFDELYDFYVTRIQQRFADVLSFLDIFVVKGLLVRGSAGVVAVLGIVARALHVGNLQGYVYWFLGGMILFWFVAFNLF